MGQAAGKVFSPLNAFYPQDPLRVSHPQVLFASLLRASPQGARLPGPHRSPMTLQRLSAARSSRVLRL